jgi:molecular chaperone DnaK (HSP70)
MSAEHRVVAAIDFGTHGTGFAWAAVSRENTALAIRRVNYFDSWEGQDLPFQKNRSALLLDPQQSLKAWGHAAVRQAESLPAHSDLTLYQNFKMDLQANLGTPLTLEDERGAHGRDAPDTYRLVVLCLRQAFRQALEVITAGPYVESDIRWCVTVPAIWDGYTRDLMRKAAVAAGLPDDPERLLLAREPTAAALYCVAKGERLLTTAGTRFMVVDAGGGTIDITSYQVKGDGRLDELGLPTGAKSGSEYLNREFTDQVLAEHFGPDFFRLLVSEHRQMLYPLLAAWERVKRSFSTASTDGLSVPLHAPLYKLLLRDVASRHTGADFPDPPTEVVIGRAEVSALFDRIIGPTLATVDEQLRGMRAASGITGGEVVVLVGGFAESPYLRQQLRSFLIQRDVRLLVPELPSTAVVTGAVHFAYDNSPFLTWRAPFTCGVDIALPFRDGVDPQADRFVNDDGNVFCTNRFDPFIRCREPVETGRAITRQYIASRRDQRVITLDLLTSPNPDVEYATEADVTRAGRLEVDISSSVGRPLSERSVEVTMTLNDTQVFVTARNTATGEPYSTQFSWSPTW